MRSLGRLRGDELLHQPPVQFNDDEAYQLVEDFIRKHVPVAKVVG